MRIRHVIHKNYSNRLMLASLVRTTIDILLLRKGPQDMPVANEALIQAAALYVLANSAALATLSVPIIGAVLMAMLALGVPVIFAWLLLRLTGFANRFVQTLAALLATEAVFTLLLLGPLSVILPYAQIAAETGTPPEVMLPGLMSYAVLGLIIWAVVVMGHILKHALDIAMTGGVLIALGYKLAPLLLFGLAGGG